MLTVVEPAGPPPPTSPAGGVVKKTLATPGAGGVPRLLPANRTAALLARARLAKVRLAGADAATGVVGVPSGPADTATTAPPVRVRAPALTAVATVGWPVTM